MISTSLTWVCGLVVAAFLIYWVPWLIVTWIRINRIPGPPTYPIIGNLLDISVSSDQLWIVLRNWGKKYYPVYRIWSGPVTAVALLCPDDIEKLLATPKHSTKSQIYTLLEPWLRTGLLTSAGAKWQHRRKILTPSFHFNILQQFLGIFTEQTQILVKRLRRECDESETNILPIITKFTLHSICDTAMGTRLDEGKKSSEYLNAVYRMGELIFYRVLRPLLYIDATFYLTPQCREMKRVTEFLHSFSMSVIKERKANFVNRDFTKEETNNDLTTRKRLAMLDLLIAAQESGVNIDDEGIREEVDTFMFEGHDTTAMCICFTLMLLANHKDIQEKVVEELQDVFSDSDRSPTYQDLQNLSYLELVIKESLRMYPSVPLIARTTDEAIHTRCGHVVPGSIFVHIYIYDLHHNSELYPDPEKFDPDRFLPENCQKRHPFAYLPFSAGPRNCIGQKFAMLELKAAIAGILRNFILEPIDKPSDIVLMMDIIIRPKHGIKIKFRPRPQRQ